MVLHIKYDPDDKRIGQQAFELGEFLQVPRYKKHEETWATIKNLLHPAAPTVLTFLVTFLLFRLVPKIETPIETFCYVFLIGFILFFSLWLLLCLGTSKLLVFVENNLRRREWLSPFGGLKALSAEQGALDAFRLSSELYSMGYQEGNDYDLTPDEMFSLLGLLVTHGITAWSATERKSLAAGCGSLRCVVDIQAGHNCRAAKVSILIDDCDTARL